MWTSVYSIQLNVALKKNSLVSPKLLPFVFLFSLPLIVFSQGQISGKLEDVEADSKLEIYYLLGTTAKNIESLDLRSGKFKSSKEYQRGFYRIGKSEDQSKVLAMGNEDLKLQGTWGKWSDLKVKPSMEDSLFTLFQKIIRAGNKGVQQLSTEAQKTMRLQSKDPEAYQAKMAKLQLRFDSLMLDQSQRLNKIYLENQNTYIGKMAGYLLLPEGVRTYDYFDVASLSDREYLSGEIVKTKLSVYFQRYLGGNPKNWALRMDQLLEASPSSDAKLVLYSAGMEIFVNLDQQYTAKLARRFYKDFPDSELAQFYYEQLPKPPPAVGDVAPNIALNNSDGELMNLTDLRGKVVLLDFWASWCGPCRRENPNVVRAYNEFRDQGFTVFSVSLDNNKDKWIGAIAKDGLAWENHVSDLKGWKSAGAKKYGVRSIPATFLIDKEGVIRAVNVRGQKLENELNKLLDSGKKDG